MSESENIVYDKQTKFEHYQVIDMVYIGRSARVLFSGDRVAAQSGVPRDNNPHMLFDYNQRFLELFYFLKPKSILLIGGGGFTLPIKILEDSLPVNIDVAELDSDLEEIAKRFFGLKKNKRLKIFFEDGRTFLKHTKKQYDLILIDAFLGNKIPQHMSTYEFLEIVKSRLSKNGVLATNIISAYHSPTNELIRNQYATNTAVFKHVDIIPADKNLTLWISQNFLLISTNNPHKPKYKLSSGAIQPPLFKQNDVLHDQQFDIIKR